MSSFWLALKQQWTIKISSHLFSIFSLAAILVGSRDQQTQFWKRAMQIPFHQSLVAIGPMVSEEKFKVYEGRTDAKWWQKFTWPLARWAKIGHVPQKITILKWICDHVNLNPIKFNNKKSCMNVSVAIQYHRITTIEVSALISCIASICCLYEISTQN